MKDAEAVSGRARPGGTRCPFCHEGCEPDGDACACADCLARHHATCWHEAGGCASCRGTRRLDLAAEAPRGDDVYGPAIEAWLRLGLVYNGGLALLSVLLLRSALLSPAVLVQVAFGALLANLCFMTGPGIELVARRLGYRGDWLRWLLFVPGFAFAALLAFVSCLSVL